MPNAWILALPLVVPGIWLALCRRAVLCRMSDVTGYSQGEKSAAVLASVAQYPFFLMTLWCPLVRSRPLLLFGSIVYLVGATCYWAAVIQYAQTPDAVLRTDGLYRLSRHPMYCAASLSLLAICLLAASLPLTIWLLVVLVCQHIMIRAEERRCGEKFGAAYADYCRRAPRYLLWV